MILVRVLLFLCYEFVNHSNTINMSEAENEHEINASGKFMWGQPTFTYLDSQSSLEEIVSLDLSTNHINIESATLLADLLRKSQNLKYLSLIQTKLIQKSSVLIFSAIGDSQLLEFYADDNIFQASPCEALGASLSKNPPLELLSLNGCDIPDEGINHIASSLYSNNHLLHLRLESNSMFDYGAQKLGEALPKSSLISLSVADNQIWNEGTTSIILNISHSHLESLDLSYNIVELETLATELEKSRISSLAISGCKVNERQLINFLQRIPNYGLKTLIMDGFNFQMLPISWPSVKDTLWSNQPYFDALKNSLISPTITDLRIGYFDLDQIFILNKILESRQNELVISFHNFGQTKDIWLFKLPGPYFESPTSIFRWEGKIDNQNCQFIGQIVSQTKVFDGKHQTIETLDFHNLGLDDEVVRLIMTSMRDFPVKNINFYKNKINDDSLEVFTEYIKRVKLDSLNLGDNKTTDEGISTFLRDIQNPSIFPRKITLSFKIADQNEFSKHKISEVISSILQDNNFNIEFLSLSGPITVSDATEIISSFSSNSHLREIQLHSEHEKKYETPDPDLNEGLQLKFIEFADILHANIVGEDSICKLRKFYFPLFTEIYLYHNDIYQKWIEIDAKLNNN